MTTGPALTDSAPRGSDDAVRVMLVDDSAVIRGLTTRWLEADGRVAVVASAPDGKSALRMIERADPDVIVLDIEMPGMDGLTALPQLLKAAPEARVVMASTLTRRNAEISLKGMSLGASDYLAKPPAARGGEAEAYRRELVEKVRALGARRRLRQRAPAPNRPRPATPAHGLYGSVPVVLRAPATVPPRVVAIGSSTGGPQALQAVLAGLGTRLTVPVLITQHMPPTFTALLAGQLTRGAGVDCREAVDGEPLAAGRVYLAPGDNHMVVQKRGTEVVVRLDRSPPENFCRPSVDPMLRSLVQAFGGQVLTVMLTGMGHDGLAGAEAVVRAGGTVIAQDEPTSVVWGMPGAVATGGFCAAVLPLQEIAAGILRQARGTA